MTTTGPAWSWWVAHCKVNYPELQGEEQIFAKLLAEAANIVGQQG